MSELHDFVLQRRASAPTPDEDLVRRCLEGDDGAWSALIEKYKDLVWSIPLKYGLTPEDSADIFQGVWIDLFGDLKNLRNVGALRSWLITTAGRKCYHWKARQHSLVQMNTVDTKWEPEDNRPSLTQIRLQAEREQSLRQAMSGLSPRCKQLVKMLFFEQPSRPYKEIADSFGLAIGSIGFIRGRCLEKLRESLSARNF